MVHEDRQPTAGDRVPAAVVERSRGGTVTTRRLQWDHHAIVEVADVEAGN